MILFYGRQFEISACSQGVKQRQTLNMRKQYVNSNKAIGDIVDVNDIAGSYSRLCQSYKDILKFMFDKCHKGQKRLKKLNKYCKKIQKALKDGPNVTT